MVLISITKLISVGTNDLIIKVMMIIFLMLTMMMMLGMTIKEKKNGNITDIKDRNSAMLIRVKMVTLLLTTDNSNNDNDRDMNDSISDRIFYLPWSQIKLP